jgi:hypothetical protein
MLSLRRSIGKAVRDPLLELDALECLTCHIEAAGFVPASAQLWRDRANLRRDQFDARAMEYAAEIDLRAFLSIPRSDDDSSAEGGVFNRIVQRRWRTSSVRMSNRICLACRQTRSLAHHEILMETHDIDPHRMPSASDSKVIACNQFLQRKLAQQRSCQQAHHPLSQNQNALA